MNTLDNPGSRGFDFGAGRAFFQMFVVRRDDCIEGWLNRCPHAGHPLDFPQHQFFARGKGRLRCASHGAEFEFKTGKCIEGPCLGRTLLPVPLLIEGGMIKIGTEDGA
jgi:naringenin degradation protein FdeD